MRIQYTLKACSHEFLLFNQPMKSIYLVWRETIDMLIWVSLFVAFWLVAHHQGLLFACERSQKIKHCELVKIAMWTSHAICKHSPANFKERIACDLRMKWKWTFGHVSNSKFHIHRAYCKLLLSFVSIHIILIALNLARESSHLKKALNYERSGVQISNTWLHTTIY